MIKYIVVDNEDCQFMDYTFDNPMTRKELIEHFYSLGQNEEFETLKKYYNLNYIQNTWNVSLIKVNVPKCRGKLCPYCHLQLYKSTTKGYYTQCFNCDEDFYSFEVIKK